MVHCSTVYMFSMATVIETMKYGTRLNVEPNKNADTPHTNAIT